MILRGPRDDHCRPLLASQRNEKLPWQLEKRAGSLHTRLCAPPRLCPVPAPVPSIWFASRHDPIDQNPSSRRRKLFIVFLVVSFDRRYIAFTRIPPARAMESPLMCWPLTLNLAIVNSSSIKPIPIPESSRSVSCCSCDDGCDIGCGMKKA